VTWAFIGIGVSLAAGLFAFARARRETRSFYEFDVYGMTARSHRRFALLSLAFAAAFSVRLLWARMPDNVRFEQAAYTPNASIRVYIAPRHRNGSVSSVSHQAGRDAASYDFYS